jgi:hypothetical protein
MARLRVGPTTGTTKEAQTMRRTLRILGVVGIGLVGMAVLGAGTARAEILDERQLDVEMRRNYALREQVRHAGYPDLAQRVHGSTTWPWQPSVIRLVYLEPRTEVGVSRAYVDERPEIGIIRYRRALTDELANEVARFLATMPPPADPVARAELAARRAEAAATRAELGATSAERAVDRLERVTAQMESAFQQRLRK